MRFYEDSRSFFLTLPNGNEESVLAKTQRIFCSYSPLRMRSAFGEKSENKLFAPHFTTEELKTVLAKKSYIFMKFLPLSLTWEKCQPPLPIGGERLV